jgi:hypothetical protein
MMNRAAAAYKKNRKRNTIKTSKKYIYNEVLKSTNDDVCSIIDPLHKNENNVT